jgi:hypothetical protein
VNVADGGYDGHLALAGDELAELVRRLRSLSPQAWTPRRAGVQAAVARLAELVGRAEGHPTGPLPAIPDHALADALAVIGGDAIVALEADRDDDLLSTLLVELRDTLQGTR